MKNGLIRESLRIARGKLPSHPQFFHWPHFAFIIQDNKIIEWAYNTNAEPARHLGYHTQLEGGMAKTHAELNAYRAAKGLLDHKKTFEVVNIRLSKLGKIRLSKPCDCCTNFLRAMGCSQCWFSTADGWIKVGVA